MTRQRSPPLSHPAGRRPRRKMRRRPVRRSRSGRDVYGRMIGNAGPDIAHLRVGDGNTPIRPIPQMMDIPEQAPAIGKPVDHDAATGRKAIGFSVALIILTWIGNVQGEMRHGLGISPVYFIASFRCFLVAFPLLGTLIGSTPKRNPVCRDGSVPFEQDHATFGFINANEVGPLLQRRIRRRRA